MTRALDREDVIAVYRALLKRAPESNNVIENKIARMGSLEDLLRSVLHSDEFVQKSVPNTLATNPRSTELSAPIDIQVSGSREEMHALIEHTRAIWSQYGVADPYYSVLTAERYRREVIDEAAISEFYETGRRTQQLILDTLRRNGLELPQFPAVLDFGCGLGRVGLHFARISGRFLGVDISRPHLQQAELRFRALNVVNAEFLLLQDFLTFKTEVDLAYSVIVLQHNPPPLIDLLISQMCAALRPSGVLFIQVPTALRNYNFRIDDYLTNIPTHGKMEMHAIPQRDVFRILQENNCRPVEVFQYDMIGPIGESTIFLATKM